MDRAHNAGLDRSQIVQSLCHRGKAVGGAGSGGDDLVFLGQRVVVDVIDDGGQIVAGRSGDNDLAGACVDMSLCLCLAGIEAGALQHDVNAQLAPGQLSSVRHLVDDDLLAVDNDVVVFAFALMEINGVTLRNVVALRGVVLQKMRQHLCRGQVVDGDNLVAFRAEHLTECQTADTSKTIDRNFNRHE